MESRWARVARGTGAGTFATLVAGASHSLAGQQAPSSAGIALALSFSVLISIALSGRRLSAPRLAIAVTASQLAFHTVFSAVGGAGTVVHGEGHHAVQYVIAGSTVVIDHSGPVMWIAHLVAATITFAAVLHGERAFFGLAGTARLALRAILTLWVPATEIGDPVRTRVRADTRIHARAVREFLEVLDTRGPPAAARVA
jgi:hypothetical protein